MANSLALNLTQERTWVTLTQAPTDFSFGDIPPVQIIIGTGGSNERLVLERGVAFQVRNGERANFTYVAMRPAPRSWTAGIAVFVSLDQEAELVGLQDLAGEQGLTLGVGNFPSTVSTTLLTED